MARTGIGKGNHPNSRKNLKNWKPGQSGNPKGRPPDAKYVSEELKQLLATGMEGREALVTAIARQLLKRALKSDAALAILLERTEGKVTQPFAGQITGDIVFTIGKGYANDKPDIQSDKQATG